MTRIAVVGELVSAFVAAAVEALTETTHRRIL